MRNAWRLILVLGLVSVASGVILAGFYGWMNPRIEAQRLREQFEVGFKQIFPDAADFREVSAQAPVPAGVEEPVYEALDASGKSLGLVYNVIGNGYGGPIKIAVGLDPNQGRLKGVAVLSHTETAGLGSRIEEASFRDQFAGKLVTDPFQVGQDVDGVTAATISSKAVASAVGGSARELLTALGYKLPQPRTTAQRQVSAAEQQEEATHAGPPVEAAQALYGSDVALAGPIWPVRNADGTLVGVAAEGSAEGFKGPIRVLVAVDPKAGVVRGIHVLEQNETRGLGTKVAEPEFTGQFAGKPLDSPFQVGVDVDAVTRATISSKAVAEAVAQAVQSVTAVFGLDR